MPFELLFELLLLLLQYTMSLVSHVATLFFFPRQGGLADYLLTGMACTQTGSVKYQGEGFTAGFG